MTLSMNEIEATAKKAVRGAGYPWGLAEEAAKATRWLCARDLDGCAALARLLKQADGGTLAERSPLPRGSVWSAAGGTLCPIAAGAALSDRAHEMTPEGLQLDAVAQPLLLVPFAALLARQIGQAITLQWAGTVVTTDGDGVETRGPLSEPSARVAVRIGGELTSPNATRHRADPAPDIWEALARLAHRTYAPATEESRLKGAGGDL